MAYFGKFSENNMSQDEYNSWMAWQKAILAKLDDLDKGQYLFRDQLMELNNRLIETVGISGKNGKVGMLTVRVAALEHKLDKFENSLTKTEERVKTTKNADKSKLLAGGAVGGGSLAALVELIKLWIG